ncbi:polysaccharide pyruvyl transferase CsaB [Natronincola peptidivorans]|uniref:Polysaccharide pyruvyl transferase CsaB n=1 Tax=Natronincola peptidivorans TaxID=426128 RepID=A0A1I0BHS5_9FIRM|nr:polysaccharide pyruvyl transferase CsaB [Natronincola peptidivorans]SET06146.1 polysaccharide pyruvyl transferase CsaB [Natronincola peptidivorans]
MKKIFLFGYYGFQNTGDEAILEALIEQIRTALPNAKLSALSYSAQDTWEKYNIDAVSRNDFKEVIKAIRASDVVISGGGSILQDVTSSRSLLYYSAIILLAKKLGKKVMFYGNGFGPINRYFNKKLVKYIINQVDTITVRDYQSKEYMQSLGIKKDIIVTADIAFGLEAVPSEEIEKIFQWESMDITKKWVGISIREWKNEKNYKEVIAKTADYLINRNYDIVFIPMQFPSDIDISKEIASMMNNTPKIITTKYNPRQIIGIISKMNLLIGMRLHSLIFAAIAEIPMVGLEYDAKIKNFLKLANQKSGGVVEKLDIIHLWTSIDSVLEHGDQHVENLREIKKNLYKKTEINIEIFTRFVQEGEKR